MDRYRQMAQKETYRKTEKEISKYFFSPVSIAIWLINSGCDRRSFSWPIHKNIVQ